MEHLISLLCRPFGWLMNQCYMLVGNYGIAIIIFTFLTKVILLPLTLWTYFNGITMIKIQPDINYVQMKYYGQKDRIAEEESKIFKQYKYNPLASIIPTFAQLFLLMAVIEVIKAGINNPNINMTFVTVNLGLIPSQNGMSLIWSPFLAGLAALVLCIAQNASSVLQAEQSKVNKYGMTLFSVGLSLYLGWFVSVGTALYWVCSNLMSVLQLYIMNWIFEPRQYVDYVRLEESRKQLRELKEIGHKKKESFFSTNRKKERKDYKRFFSVVNKHLVFYSESNGYYKYFKGVIEYLLANTNIVIHYITSDPNDQIFEMEKTYDKIRAYYIGENKLITLMMKMDADIVCMTMPDLGNYHIKRSYVRDDIEYIYFPHAMDSGNLTTRTGSKDHFDTIFCVGPHHVEENTKIDIAYNLKPRKYVEYGYDLFDEMRRNYDNIKKIEGIKKKILIAPSWQEDNIIDLCLDKILNQLKQFNYEVTVRPHPQQVRHQREYFEKMKAEYEPLGIIIQTDFTESSTIWESDLVITDWSGIAMDFSMTTLKPTLFINTPMKIMNPEYQKIDTIPINIEMRNVIGTNLDVNQLDDLGAVIEKLFADEEKYRPVIEQWVDEKIFNIGHAAEAGGKYIVSSIKEHIKEKTMRTNKVLKG